MHQLVQYISKNLPINIKYDLHCCVALSGGIDSVVLLHILTKLRQLHNLELVAMHVNHGISPNANTWQEFCADLCTELNIPFKFIKHTIIKGGGNSLENEARQVRYNALLNNECNIIALAHHQQDQIETLLSQLLRGSNIHNFASMHTLTTKNDKCLWRPLLNIPKSQIIAYAEEHHLKFINDESNHDTQYLRNFLRHDIIPLLIQQDQHIGNKLIKTVNELQNSTQLIDELASIDLTSCKTHNNASIISLDITEFKKLKLIRQVNLLSYFLRLQNLALPSEKQLIEFVKQACTSRWERMPQVKINQKYTLVKNKSFIMLHQQ